MLVVDGWCGIWGYGFRCFMLYRRNHVNMGVCCDNPYGAHFVKHPILLYSILKLQHFTMTALSPTHFFFHAILLLGWQNVFNVNFKRSYLSSCNDEVVHKEYLNNNWTYLVNILIWPDCFFCQLASACKSHHNHVLRNSIYKYILTFWQVWALFRLRHLQ